MSLRLIHYHSNSEYVWGRTLLGVWQRDAARREKGREMGHSLTASIIHFHYYLNPGFVQVCAFFQAAVAPEETHPSRASLGGSDWTAGNHIPVARGWFGNGHYTQFWPARHGRLLRNVFLLLREQKRCCLFFLRVLSCRGESWHYWSHLAISLRWRRCPRTAEQKDGKTLDLWSHGWATETAYPTLRPLRITVIAMDAFPYCLKMLESVFMTWSQKHPNWNNLPYNKYSSNITRF